MLFHNLLNNINPKTLFLVDSLGALLSALMLGIVLTEFENSIGIPKWALYVLSFLACIFFIYSFLCFLFTTENWRPYLKIVAIANLMYFFFSIGLLIYLSKTITILGVAYFTMELIVIITLAVIELNKAFKLTKQITNTRQ